MPLMLVVVALVGGVMVPVMGVILMIAVSHGFMPAAVAVHVGVLLMGDVRQAMLVVVVAAIVFLNMALVDVVHVALVRGSGMPALWPMGMVMIRMQVVLSGHGSCSFSKLQHTPKRLPTMMAESSRLRSIRPAFQNRSPPRRRCRAATPRKSSVRCR